MGEEASVTCVGMHNTFHVCLWQADFAHLLFVRSQNEGGCIVRPSLGIVPAGLVFSFLVWLIGWEARKEREMTCGKLKC